MTKGKWIYGKDQREEKHYYIGPENDFACTVDIADVMNEQDAQAIAAVPDLIEALQEALYFISDDIPGVTKETVKANLQQALQKAGVKEVEG